MPDIISLRKTFGGAILVGVTVLGAAASAASQSADTPDASPTELGSGAPEVSASQLLEDFAFYVMVANYELAKANAQALIDRDLDPKVMLGLVEDSTTMQERFERSYRRALVVPGLEESAAALYKLYEDGKLARARNPVEIERNIGLLTGNPRAQLLARDRLVYAGEYAVPQLLQVLVNRQNQYLQTEVASVLIQLGRQSVMPLCTALLGVDPATQETIARVLGRIGYESAKPYLAELAGKTSSDQVRTAASAALAACGGDDAMGNSVAALYRMLGEEYYAEVKSVTSFPGEEFQLLWTFEPSLGLQPAAVRTEVYHEAVAMSLAEHALELDPADSLAVGLWVASNFSREIDHPEGYENPAYPEDVRREAMYYAVAAGPTTLRGVLQRALDDRDTPLARRAIEALSLCAGASALTADSATALVNALVYPERRVRFEAALALGRAKPRETFDGAERVVPTLAGWLRDAEKRYGLVLAADAQRQGALRTLLEGLGYTVLPPAVQLSDAEASISEAPGIDLILTELSGEATSELIGQVRSSTRLQAAPIFSLLTAAGLTQYSGQFENDRLSTFGREGLTEEQVGEALEEFVIRASGAPLTEEESIAYSNEALDTLRDLAIGSESSGLAGAFDIGDAAPALLSALEQTEGDLRLKVADVLSFIGQRRAQVGLMDAAMNAESDERLALMERINGSAKRFGNLLEERQVRWILDITQKAEREEATAAAALIGALGLPNENLVPLLTRKSR